MKNLFLFALLCMGLSFSACDKKNDDLLTPLSSEEFPQVLVLADEGDGELEDEDKFSFSITLADRKDPDGDELGGKVIPLNAPVTVQFEITDFEGFDKISDYIKDVSAFYEIDDCDDEDVDIQFDVSTGQGTVVFPAGVEEIEIEFETDDALFDDNEFNTTERSVTIQLTGIAGAGPDVVVNRTGKFVYEVQDDEAIYGEWKLDVSDPDEFNRFKELFGLINDDIKNLDAKDVEEIVLAFEFEELKAIVVLKETEQVNDCGTIETENKIIEIEAEIEDIDDSELEGDLEFGEVIELSAGGLRPYVYEGSFEIAGKKLKLVLKGEFGNDETDDIILTLEK